MQVPLTQRDYDDVFLSICKKALKFWPSEKPIKLSTVQQILSKGLGYRDFYDLQHSLLNSFPPALQSPSIDGLNAQLEAHLIICELSSEQAKKLVSQLPINALSFFKKMNSLNSSSTEKSDDSLERLIVFIAGMSSNAYGWMSIAAGHVSIYLDDEESLKTEDQYITEIHDFVDFLDFQNFTERTHIDIYESNYEIKQAELMEIKKFCESAIHCDRKILTELIRKEYREHMEQLGYD